MVKDLDRAKSLVGQIEAEGIDSKNAEVVDAARKLLNQLLEEEEREGQEKDSGGEGGDGGEEGDSDGDAEGDSESDAADEGAEGEGGGPPSGGKTPGGGKGKLKGPMEKAGGSGKSGGAGEAPEGEEDGGSAEGDGGESEEEGLGEAGEGASEETPADGGLKEAQRQAADKSAAEEAERAAKARKVRGAEGEETEDSKQRDAEDRFVERRARRSERTQNGPDVRELLEPEEVARGSGGLLGGSGMGSLVESPGSRPRYDSLLRSYAAEIHRSGRRLKEIMLPTMKTQQYQRSGRFMANQSTRFYIDSQSRSLEEMFKQSRMVFGGEIPAIALCQDVSGSFAPHRPDLHMAHLGEALRMSFPPNRFALYAFGVNWTIIKSFRDQWAVLDRVPSAGPVCGQSTENIAAVVRALMDLSATPAKYKVLIVISDFALTGGTGYDGTAMSNLLLKAKRAGIRVLPVQAGFGSDREMIHCLPTRHIFFRIRQIDETTGFVINYLKFFLKGEPVPGAFWTPDGPGGSVTQTPASGR